MDPGQGHAGCTTTTAPSVQDRGLTMARKEALRLKSRASRVASAKISQMLRAETLGADSYTGNCQDFSQTQRACEGLLFFTTRLHTILLEPTLAMSSHTPVHCQAYK